MYIKQRAQLFRLMIQSESPVWGFHGSLERAEKARDKWAEMAPQMLMVGATGIIGVVSGHWVLGGLGVLFGFNPVVQWCLLSVKIRRHGRPCKECN